MPFKIVQTIEDEKINLTIIPSKWEQNGTLFWPVRRNEVKLIHDEESVPKTDWKRLQCIKKREYLTIKEAEREQEIMEQASDTDTEANSYLCTSKKSRPPYSTRVLQPIDLNDQIFYQNSVANVKVSSNENYVDVENNEEPVLITIRANAEQEFASTSKHNIDIANDSPPGVTLVTNLDTNNSDSKSSSNASEPNSDTYVTFSPNQVFAQILENQAKMLSQLASLQASVDFLLGANMKVKPTEKPLNRLLIQPINSKNDFDELESKLKDETFYNKLVTELTFVCGNSGKCNGVDSCYKLVDYFFTRQIFVHCNWTGSTRDSNAEKKIPFKYYSRIRNSFLDIIMKSDSSFTETHADKFFKVVIKNAKPRLQSKVDSVKRTSKPRVKKQQVGNGLNIEQPQQNEVSVNNESPPPQQMPNEEEQPQQNGVSVNNESPPPQQMPNEEEQPQQNGVSVNNESPPPQQIPNEEAVINVPLPNESGADNLNGDENEREVVQNNERD